MSEVTALATVLRNEMDPSRGESTTTQLNSLNSLSKQSNESPGTIEVPLEFKLRTAVEFGDMTAQEADAIREQAREVWKTNIRAEMKLAKAQRTAELEAKYAIELSPEDYNALSTADRELTSCKACIFRRCDKYYERERYWQPTIRIVAGKPIIGRERCPRWNFHVNELCHRAGVPGIYLGKTLADYQKTADNAEAIAMARWYIEEYPKNCGLYFYGGAGTGKTLLASIITRELICAGRKVIFGDVPHLLKKIKERFDASAMVTYDDNITAHMVQDKYATAEVLVLDDIGAGQTTAWSVGVLYEIINERYSNGLRTIVTSNFDLDTLAKVLSEKGEGWQVDRIVSRLCGMCEEGYFGEKDRRRPKRRYA